jgi:SAM-dependent methyltransferase
VAEDVERAAARFSVLACIHPDDMLWKFVREHPFHAELFSAADYYFADGAESGQKLAKLARDHVPAAAAGQPYSLLEFASGYGMVTRHLRNAVPNADVTSCDIHSEAVEFIRDDLGETAVVSEHLPEDLALEGRYDVVFALSFFSHMPESTFGRWLAALYGVVNPGGVLAFTTHGLGSRATVGNPEIPESGIWFRESSEQDDLDSAEYGSTICTPDFVVRQLFSVIRRPVVAEFKTSYWWGVQDLYVVAKPANQPSRSAGPGRRFGLARRRRKAS